MYFHSFTLIIISLKIQKATHVILGTGSYRNTIINIYIYI